ncbi:Glyoxalase/Bleomycin resistance protein/Dihydroxybiphenyl dioxygenase [Gigaspora rosea]|uniref:Glyoxalase/Bleomycin resistance protein/Dihydroxybiphenyl dioxygenase n=1 Tax=Gigaspora rosea TaxID=44941 RepID=A0A397VG89_9GLOM|nr:Glyoxalase/Bleomycin resistance protein/Dihydroxybiphenyl dioxygenase [Gigaspora rosea]
MSQQPVLGTIHHFCICISDYKKSVEFYDSFLPKLGYKMIRNNDIYSSWVNQSLGQFVITKPKEEYKDIQHTRYAVGYHHLAWNATSKEEVDKFYEFLVEKNYKILDAPKDYNYAPVYYAVFWEDPDGFKLELCYVPFPYESENKQE